MVFFYGKWQRVAVCAVLLVPAVLIVLALVVPAIVLAFLPYGQRFILNVFSEIATLVKILLARTNEFDEIESSVNRKRQ
ncbi:hypothetical protein GCM10022248_58180 [Nonomuraea soli]